MSEQQDQAAPRKRVRGQQETYTITREYAPDRARMLAAVRLVLGLPETPEGGRLFIRRVKPEVEKAA